MFQTISFIYDTGQQDYHIAHCLGKINMFNIFIFFSIASSRYIIFKAQVWPSSPTPQLQLKIQLQNYLPGGGLLPVKLNNISLTYWVTHLIPCQPRRRRYIMPRAVDTAGGETKYCLFESVFIYVNAPQALLERPSALTTSAHDTAWHQSTCYNGSSDKEQPWN